MNQEAEQVQRELNRTENMRLDAAHLPVRSGVLEHALILINVHNGDHLAAWMLALLILRYTPKSDPEQRQYWFNVAEAIAQCRPATVEPQFFRGSQFASARRTSK